MDEKFIPFVVPRDSVDQCEQVVSLPPCQAACPAGLDIPGYITLLGAGNYTAALERIYEDLPLPGTLGRICEHPCQTACRRGQVDRPVEICALKRVVYDRTRQAVPRPVHLPVKYPEKVAVVGSGPAGLAAAYFLARKGYKVTIFESMPRPGGMLAYGIPPYRLPRQVLWEEIAYIQALGVDLQLNHPVRGREGLTRLFQQRYMAVFLATGAWQSTIPLVDAAGIAGVYDGIGFLRTANTALMEERYPAELGVAGRRVAVVGGGNVAIDVARTALRLGASEVYTVYRRSKEEMPALAEEIWAAEIEGVKWHFLTSPLEVKSFNGSVVGLRCQQNRLSEPDASGRRRPVPVAGSEWDLPVDIVVFATGQRPDLEYLEGLSGEIGVQDQRIVVNSYQQTGLPMVFAGGDSVTGPASAVRAIAAGRRAAEGIDAYLRGHQLTEGLFVPQRREPQPPLLVSAGQRQNSGAIDHHRLYQTEKKSGFEEIMAAPDITAAMAEARRCLRCDICQACGRCVDTCTNQIGVAALQLGYVTGGSGPTDFTRVAERCLGCGSCVNNCPHGALTATDREGYREIRLTGALLARLPLVHCAHCGRPFVTTRHLSFINALLTDGEIRRGELGLLEQYAAERVCDLPVQSAAADLYTNRAVCPDCARSVWLQNVYGA
ncbi:MAG: FAD-dependent oxidoreductase [Bacillota bacterium]|uniref:FAD-dependent oxidoreductase n=1 Tax=Desulfurispora thermophila TaxID=265470 RepID=UPI00036E53D9|nr:FAD-dependent oxidoreductase [Desulfurispora thermophila]